MVAPPNCRGRSFMAALWTGSTEQDSIRAERKASSSVNELSSSQRITFSAYMRPFYASPLPSRLVLACTSNDFPTVQRQIQRHIRKSIGQRKALLDRLLRCRFGLSGFPWPFSRLMSGLNLRLSALDAAVVSPLCTAVKGFFRQVFLPPHGPPRPSPRRCPPLRPS